MSEFDWVFPSLCYYCGGPAELWRSFVAMIVWVWHDNFSPNVAGLDSARRDSGDRQMSCAALVDLRDSLDTMLRQIRSERHISSPVFTCPKCGLRGPVAEPRVSVRAMILALLRFGIAPPAKTKTLEREWSSYREEQGLDLYGKSLVFENLARETNECRCKPLRHYLALSTVRPFPESPFQ
jgi:hypothetical protein